MESNPTDSGSRVTRSLRKRLTSVDSDSSSRAVTPISSKLTSISEISASPGRSTRMTRRNSTSGILTPVKTPAKRGIGSLAIVENLETNTPARRSYRRRSSSINENEDTPQAGIKLPKFEALDEEILQSDNETTRVTRSQSKSPQQSEPFKTTASPKKPKSHNENKNKEIKAQNAKTDTPIKRKSGPKCKIRENGEDTSDVEITVLGNEIKDIKNKSSNITTIILSDDESNQMTSPKIKETENNLEDCELPHTIKAAEQEILNNNELLIENNNIGESSSLYNSGQNNTLRTATTTNITTEEPINENSDQKKVEESTPLSQSKELDNIEKENNQENDYQHENINAPVTTVKENESNSEEVNAQENKTTASITEDVEFNACSENVNQLDTEDYSTPKTNEKRLSSDRVVITSGKNFKNRSEYEDSNITDCQVLSKKVEFVSSPNDMTIKNVYPKTPASTKASKSFKLLNSSRNDGSFLAEYNAFIRSDILENEFRGNEDNNIDINNQKLESQIIQTEISPKPDLNSSKSFEIVQQSLILNNVESPKCKDPLPIAETNSNEDKQEVKKKALNKLDTNLDGEIMETNEHESSANKMSDNDKTHSPKQKKDELKWINPCVKRTTASGSKLDNVDTENNKIANDCSGSTDKAVKEIQLNESNTFLSKEKEGEEHELDFNETTSEEESYKQKHDFHDDEAVEVNDYESGDSMDSEERKEMEENEIPVDSRSIGSHTTEDDQDECEEEEDSENADSFIVSDEEELKSLENDAEEEEEEEEIDKDKNGHNYKNKGKTYKRVLHLAELSSSSDEDNDKSRKSDDVRKEIVENVNIDGKLESPEENSQSEKEKIGDENVTETNILKSNSNSCESITETNNLLSKPNENIILDTSKLSDSAFRLHCTAESESEEENIETNISRNEILRNLNQSDCFNKSVHYLNRKSDEYQMENFENSIDEGHSTTTSPDESDGRTPNGKKIQSENQLGEVSVTSGSDPEKEFDDNSLFVSRRRKNDSRLNVSSSSYKNSKGSQEWQRSFKIDVTLKDGEVEAAVTDVKLKEPDYSSTSTTDDGDHKKLKNEDIRYLENIRHMPLPLGNPLIRTRRQSLALPANPDMEICSSHVGGVGKKMKRKSLGIMPSIDFNPSQSFIESIELQKNAHSRHLAKRKRLSKSFCGYSETHDNSTVDIDICHLHKKSKLMSNSSLAESHPDSIDNISSGKLFTKISSTPYEKINKNDSYSNKEHILRRCDEILEAANRAKLEAKTNSKKSKVKISKKLSKKKSMLTSSDDTNTDDMLRKISKDINRKDKTKIALSQAIRAADNILSKKKKNNPNVVKEQDEAVATKLLAADVLEVIRESAPVKKKCKKETTHCQDEMKNVHTSSTSAGNFMELPQTPGKKKKKLSYIQLPTGKVSVEPITPKKHLVKSMNGIEFRESPITPSAIGFKVQQIAPPEIKVSPISGLMDRKRKRYCCDKLLKNSAPPKSQWTQSGLFLEEEILKRSQTARSKASYLFGESKNNKKRLKKSEENYFNRNFKENAMMRPDIRRSTKREILLLKERR